MVAITIISAIVAVIACVYSRKAHELSQKQAEEAKKEFEHTQKLSLMPYLLVENIPFRYFIVRYDCSLRLCESSKF